jgi:HSP20 family protein
MANIIRRRNDPGTLYQQDQWDPVQIMREMLQWDPFRQMVPIPGQGLTFAPQFEVKETKDSYVFKADLPGIAEKDLEVTLSGNRLNITGRREAERTEESENYFLNERHYGTFTRSFTLPEGVDFDNFDAELKDGVLSLRVPKKPESQPRKITLKGLAEKVKGAFGDKDKGKA